MIRHRWRVWFFIIFSLLAACSSSTPKPEKQTGVVKVAYFSLSGFMQQYGNLLQGYFPNVKFEVLEIPFEAYADREKLREFVNLMQPDIIVAFDYNTYKYFSEASLLTDLRPLAKRDDFDLAAFAPALLSLWADGAVGSLYGLAPYFNTSSLIYDSGMFSDYGVTAPQEGITWKEVFQLAARFPSDEGEHGLEIAGLNTPFDLMRLMGATEHLAIVNREGKQLTLDTPSWQSVFESLAVAYENNVLSLGGQSNAENNSESPAMKIQQLSVLNDATVATEKWRAISYPSISGGNAVLIVSFPAIFGIRADSSQIDLCWEVLKYLSGDKWASIKGKGSGYFSTRSSYIENAGGYDLAGKLNGEVRPAIPLEGMTSEFAQRFSPLVTEEMKDVVEGRKTAKAAIRQLQQSGQSLLAK